VHDLPDAPADRWSFGGGTAIETSVGLLLPEALVAGAGHAMVDASLMPSGNGEPATARPRRLLVYPERSPAWCPGAPGRPAGSTAGALMRPWQQ
jgi:hypothetical protein